MDRDNRSTLVISTILAYTILGLLITPVIHKSAHRRKFLHSFNQFAGVEHPKEAAPQFYVTTAYYGNYAITCSNSIAMTSNIISNSTASTGSTVTFYNPAMPAQLNTYEMGVNSVTR